MFELSHYLNKILPEHRKPKFKAWLKENLKAVVEPEGLANQLDGFFDLETACGKQLNILGEIIGRRRLLDFEPEDGSGALLEDGLYRLLLKAKIGINHWDGTVPDIYELWENLFPEYGLYIKDNQDMTMDTYILGPFPSLLRELAEHHYIVPKPMGVWVNYYFYQVVEGRRQLNLGQGAMVNAHYTGFNIVDLEVLGKQSLYLGQGEQRHTAYVGYNSLEKNIKAHQGVYRGSVGEIQGCYVGDKEGRDDEWRK